METMQRTRRGSAMLIAVIIVLLVMGLGGAFLAETIKRSQTQHATLQGDESLLMCDAAMERARRALFLYKNQNTWSWDNILTYCAASSVLTNASDIKADFLAKRTTSTWASYLGAPDSYQAMIHTKVDTLPANPTTPSTADASSLMFIGWNVPFQKGAIHVVVVDNDDSDTNLLHDSDNKVIVRVTATLVGGVQRQIEGVVEYQNDPFTFAALAAVVSNDDVQVNGNIDIDGRDWNINGTAVVGPGVLGVASTQTISVGGSAGVGGNGIAPPAKGTAAGSTSANHPFPDGYPTTPDDALGVPEGTLKLAAQASGYYFTDEASYTAMLAANGGKFPSAAIVYLEFDPSPSFDIGDSSNLNAQPSILVVHNDAGTTSVKNVHGGFKGVFLADAINHTNANTEIVGVVQLLSPAAADLANVFGNGSAKIKFSSAVLANLPSATGGSCRLLTWRKIIQ